MAVTVLTGMMRSNDEHLRQRALLCSRFLLSHNVHSRKAVLNALALTDPNDSRQVASLLETTEQKCRPGTEPYIPLWTSGQRNTGSYFVWYRHCDKDGTLVHLHLSMRHGRHRLYSNCPPTCSVEHTLQVQVDDVLWVTFPYGTAVRIPDTLVPLLAGRYPDGRKAFVAQAFGSDQKVISCCTVAEGMKAEQLRLRRWRRKKLVIPDSIQICVLRYAQETYSRLWGSDEFLNGMDDGLDATGPFSWKFEEHLSRIDTIDDANPVSTG